MIDFRYHLVSVIAIFMALAVGIVLGSGPLKPTIDQALASNYDRIVEDYAAERDRTAVLEQRAEYRDTALDAIAPALIGGRLDGRRVLLVQAPEADGDLVAEVADTLEQAGATVAGTLGLTDAYVDRERQTELEGLLDNLTPPDTDLPPEATPYVRAGNVIGRALLAGGVAPAAPAGDGAAAGGPAVDEDAAALLAGLQDLGLVTVEGEPAARSALAVMVPGPTPESVTEESAQAAQALGELALGLDRQGRGVVVAGPDEAAGDGGLISYIRATEATAGQVSTVDTIDTTVGRISAVFALLGQLRDESGHFGLGDDADQTFPDLPIPEPAPQSSAQPVEESAAEGT